MSYSSQSIALAVAPKLPALLSICGSSFICYSVLRDKAQIGSTCTRLLLGMSICDVIVSTCFLLGTIPIPAGTEGVFWAFGNQATCEIQGFFSQFSIAVAMYNASLSAFYLVKIRCHFTDKFIKRRLEPLFHALSLLFGLITASVAAALKQYNNDWWECWISPLPPDCKQSYLNGGESTCERGDNASLYRWALYYGPLWACILVVAINMISVYLAVRAVDLRASQYSSGVFNRRSKVANQGLWYCGAFYATWIFPSITSLVQVIMGSAPYPLVLVTSVFVPLQGFFNAIVYIHPRYKSLRADSSVSSDTSKPFRRGFVTRNTKISDDTSTSESLVAKTELLDPETGSVVEGLMSEEEIRAVEEAVSRVLEGSESSIEGGQTEETPNPGTGTPRKDSRRAFQSWRGMRETLKSALSGDSADDDPDKSPGSSHAGRKSDRDEKPL